MYHLLTVIAFLLFSVQLKALEPTTSAPAYQHLLDVNAQWAHYKSAAPLVEVSFRNEDERIKFHLQNVIHALRQEKPSAAKAELLKSLWQYAEDQQFPVNTGHKARRPYFIDYKQTHCAVGYLMKESGHGELAQRIRQEHNYDYLENIETAGIPEWAKEFDFTAEELAWIQPGYPVATAFSAVPGDVNGTIKGLSSSYDPQGMFLYGDFTQANGQLCGSNLAYFDGTQIQCAELGITGTVTALNPSGFGLSVVGDLQVDGNSYPLVRVLGDSVAEVFTIPSRPGAKGVAHMGAGYSQQLVIETQQGLNELWEYDGFEDEWILRAEVAGTVKGLAAGANSTLVYGLFNSATVHSDSYPDTTFTTKNIFGWDNYNPPISFNQEVPDTVLCIHRVANVSYIGGASDESPILSRYLNGVTQPLLFNSEWTPMRAIHDIKPYGQGSFVLAGDFYVADMYFGQHLGLYDPVGNYLSALGIFSEPVNTSLNYNNHWYFGGEFQETDYNYMAQLDAATGIAKAAKNEVKIYPNPVVDNVNVSVAEDWKGQKTYQLFNASGQVVKEGDFQGQQGQIAVQDLAAGKYVLTVASEGVSSSSVVVKK